MYSFPDLEPVCCSMSSSNCCFLTCIQISQETGQVVWYAHLFQNFPQFIVIHTVKGFHIVNEAEGDVFLEFSCFLYDTICVGNLISGSSASSKPGLYIWKFLFHMLLKTSLKNFEHNPTGMWNRCNFMVVWMFLALPFFEIGMKTHFPVLWTLLSFKICWHIQCSTLTAHLLGFEIVQLEFHHLR